MSRWSHASFQDDFRLVFAYTDGAMWNLVPEVVWQRAVELSVAIYGLTTNFPREEVFGLTSQLRRAGVSTASNIAEGYGRFSAKEYRNFLSIARGSVLEVQTQLVIAEKLGFGKIQEIENCKNLSTEVGKMLWAISKKL